MAKTSFAKMEEGKKSPTKKVSRPKAEAAPVEVIEEEAAGAIIEQAPQRAELAITEQQLNDAGLAGEFDQKDINLPRINLVAKTSGLVDEGFTPGAIVLNKEVTLVKKDTPLRVIVTSLVKQYQEVVDYGAEELPKTFNTEQEVYAEGGSLEWGSPNQYRPLAHITMLIEAPEGLDDHELELFPYQNGDKHYAMAIYTASKSAYGPTAKEVTTYAAFAKGAGIWTTAFYLTSKLRTEGDVSWFTPSLKRAGRLDADELGFIESVK
tara:strand:- start:765 stop:1559 length:795 start_codon:yes stop_codon:yes gene_type:complete